MKLSVIEDGGGETAFISTMLVKDRREGDTAFISIRTPTKFERGRDLGNGSDKRREKERER